WAGPDVFYVLFVEYLEENEQQPTDAALYRLDPAQGTLALVADLDGQLGFFYSIQGAVSPDGQSLALLPAAWNFPPTESLYLLDLTTGTLTEVLPAANLQLGLPANYGFGLEPLELTWTADGSALMPRYYGIAAPYDPIGNHVTYLELDTLQITPLIDLTNWPEEKWDTNRRGVPLAGQVTPDGRYFFYFVYDTPPGSDSYLWVVPTAPGARTPMPVAGEFQLNCGHSYPLFTVEGDTTQTYLLVFTLACFE
ncbi:MAG: hypothetical protein GYB65_23985, partial [Chloroflexi bacterium]|nr:hypothetical protein [Chloroflexota bacterium]